MDIAWEDREANHEAVERMLDGVELRTGDLVVLPEMFASGFSINVERTHDNDGETLRFLLRLADDLGVYIHGARAVHDCDCRLAENRATVVAPGFDGEPRLLCEYSKIHPFGYGRETEAFGGGDRVTTYEWAQGPEHLKVCPAVCYDLRFPELFRRGVDLGAEAFVIGANWPDPRQEHWRTLLIARAIENQAFVLGVNRVGNDPHLGYAGGSLAIGPKGEILAEGDDKPSVLTVELDPNAVRGWRNEFPALQDRKLGAG